jgi:nucleotide-binding universal stress UspA family protein
VRKEGRKMYKKILVPLDGSELAECVLPHLEAFIKGFHISDVTLVRVVEPEIFYHGDYPIDPEVLAKRESEMKSIAKDYLDKIVNRLKYEGTAPHAEVIVGRVMESLADYATNNDIDLLIIATHGYSGVTRWVRGSVADKILRSANVPVLMVRAPGTKGGI